MRKNHHTTDRLTGRQYRPDRGVDFMTRPGVQRLTDRRAGHQIGGDEGRGLDVTTEEGVVPAHQLIDEQKDRAVADLATRYKVPKDNAVIAELDADKRHEDALRELERLAGEQAEIKQRLAEADERTGPSTFGYRMALAFLALVTAPLDWTIAQGLAMPWPLQLIFALGIGGILTYVAHLAGKRLHVFIEGWETRWENPARYFIHAATVALLTLGPLATIFYFGALRGGLLQVIAHLLGQANPHLGPVALALTLTQLVVFIAAVVASLMYAEGQKRRELEEQLAAVLEQIKEQQGIADECDRIGALARRTIELLEEEERHEAEAIRAYAAERHARLDHARLRNHGKVTQRNAKRGRPPLPPTPMPADRTPPPKPKTPGDTVPVEHLAEIVELQVRQNGHH